MRVGGAVPARSPTPILAHLLLEASKKVLQATGTDLEIGIVARAAADVKEGGAATAPAAKILEILRACPDAPVEIDADEQNRLTIKCARSRFALSGLPRADFPTLPAPGKEASFKVPQPVLRDLVRRTLFAAAEGDARAFLAGAFLVVYGSRVRMVATDGHRLALAEAPLAGTFKKRVEVIVPAKTLNEVSRNLADEGEVEVTVGGNQIAFETGSVRLVSRLIAETFPNYEQVIPKAHDKAVKIAGAALHDAVRRVEILADHKSGAVRLRLAGDRLHIAAQDREVGEAHEEVEAACEGGEIEIAFKGRYLADALRAIDSGVVRIEFSGPLAPAVFRPASGEGKGEHLVVIMPMRV